MTPNKEDYLKRIYELGETQSKITNKEIATQMHVSAPAVSEMIKKMIGENWIAKEKSKGYVITKKGMELVSSLYRKHRLIELFLIKNLGYTSKDVHEEAEVLEHSVSDKFIDRLEKTLGFPQICPHGGIIPRKGQILNERYTKRLSEQSELGRYYLKRYHDQPDLLNYLEQNGLQLSDCFELSKIDHYTDTMSITTKHGLLLLPKVITEQLFVEKY